MTTVLVVGGAGYVGSHACKALAMAGYLPVVYDSLEYGHEWAVQWGPLEVGRIEDYDRLMGVVRKHRPVAVLHFAAYAYVGESVEDPARYYRNNVTGTLGLLEVMREAGIKDIVFSSTCATYGIPKTSAIAETHPQIPINPYGRTKLIIEQILSDYARAYGMRHAILRYFNAAGADPEGDIGEFHKPETHLIPLAIQAAFGGKPLHIFGSDYDTPDGTAIRDYIHVSDLATAHVSALRYLAEHDGSLAVNLGTGRGTSVRDIVAAVEKVSGVSVPVYYSPRRAGDPPILVAQAQHCQTTLGWKPTFTNMEEIIATACQWEKSLGTIECD